MKFTKYLYVIGGCALAGEREPISTIERISIEHENGGRTVRVHSENCGQLFKARRSPSVFARNGDTIIVAGGCYGPNNHTDSIEVLRKTDDCTWKAENTEFNCFQSHSCAAFDASSSFNNKFLIFGGFDTHNCLSSVQVVEFDDSKQSIQVKPLHGLLPKLKNSTALQISEREFLLFGGWQDESITSAVIRKIKINLNYTEYEVEFAGFLPCPIEGHCLVRKESNVFIFGGFDGCFVSDSIVRYNLETKESEILNFKLKHKRENHVAGLINDKYIVVAAGWDSKNTLGSIEVFEVIEEHPYLKNVQVLEPSKLNVPRNRPSAVVI